MSSDESNIEIEFFRKMVVWWEIHSQRRPLLEKNWCAEEILELSRIGSGMR